MNPSIQKLYNISKKKSRNIIGLMSGTSLDGLDIAFCKITGSGVDTEVDLLAFETVPYEAELKNNIRRVFAKDDIDFPYLVLLNETLGSIYSTMINGFLSKHKISGESVDLIASHGQTVMHVPKHQHSIQNMENGTLQIADGDQIAYKTGIITISDFRQKHIAAGGEGAPLSAYGDFLLFSKKDQNRILLNIGGISNFTFLPANLNSNEIFVTDLGPGNTLMDAYSRALFKLPYDKDAKIAASGKISTEFLMALKRHTFFTLPYPKSTGPEAFSKSFVEECLKSIESSITLAPQDIIATLNRFTSDTIIDGIKKCINADNPEIIVSGGGVHNPLIMKALSEAFTHCKSLSDLGGSISSDAKEAVLFAILANETIAGHPVIFGDSSRLLPVNMGKISLPE